MNANRVIIHTGVGHDDDPPGRGSGRYAWGSGENPGQHQFDFLSEVQALKRRGLTDAEIAKTLIGQKGQKKDGTIIWATTTDLRAEIAIATKAQRSINRARAIKLLDEYNGNVSAVARKMGKNESSIRSLLDPVKAERNTKYENTAKMLKKAVDSRGIIDVSNGTELYLGVTDSTKKVAIKMLEKEGYVRSWVKVPQLGTDHETSIMVLAPPGTTYGEIQKQKYDISPLLDFTPDAGVTWWTPEFPSSVDSKRIKIRYNEEGGREKDGVIELKRGVEDISLEKSQYAQVRVMVDGTHYMKGMAMYALDKDFPKGIDIIYNTNKKLGTPPSEVFKKLKTVKDKDGNEIIDRDNPFGALIKRGGQHYYTDSSGEQRLSPINKLQEEGDWDSWSRNLSSQFLAKQSIKLIKQQIDISINGKRLELDEIRRLTNPVIKKKLLEDYANGCDANASELSVKGFKNQAFQVLLPITDMKDNEIYAPNFKDGDLVALVRYPHGGTFEIPILKVNNKQATAKSVMENARDAVGINVHVADRLSGADFDGDTALVIPMASNRLKITSTPSLPGLVDWDAKEIYKLPKDAPKMKPKTKQNEMGRVSNLITDMTVGGADFNDIEKAVKHSMVVIDAEKHHLDYKQSERDNDILSLKKTYQGVNEKTGQAKGASTILSRAGAEARIPKRKEVTDVKKMTPEELERWNRGEKVYRNTGETKTVQITNPNKMTPEELQLYNAGKKVYRKTTELKEEKVHKMDIASDATELVRNKGNQKEMAYAEYANDLKALANEARKEMRAIKPIPVSQSAKKTYAAEVESLNASLRLALMNSPKERQAQVIANARVSEKLKANPDMDYEHRQRERSLALTQARAEVGAGKHKIEISDREWDAIQANAISTNKLMQILNNTDQEAFKKRATPRSSSTLTPAQIRLIESMSSSGMYTLKEIADAVGTSTSTVSATIR